jgi:hypothetical protein
MKLTFHLILVMLATAGCAGHPENGVTFRVLDAARRIPLPDVEVEKSQYSPGSKTRTNKIVGVTDREGVFRGTLGDRESFTFRKGGFAETSVSLSFDRLMVYELRPDLLPPNEGKSMDMVMPIPERERITFPYPQSGEISLGLEPVTAKPK